MRSAPAPAPAGGTLPLAKPPLYALVGNPNCGKTTVFNALTGLRQKVGNYPGVTVEKKVGRLRLPSGDAALIDLPGLYSLTPRSPDEAIARDVLLGHQTDSGQPVGILHVLDAANLERNLYLTSQLLEIGLPTIIALTMTDVAKRSGQTVNTKALSEALGVPVITVVASENVGMDALKDAIAHLGDTPPPPQRDWMLPTDAELEVAELAEMVQLEHQTPHAQSVTEAVGLLMQEKTRPEEQGRWSGPLLDHLQKDKEKFAALGLDFPNLVVESRYAWVKRVCDRAVTKPRQRPRTVTDKLDKVLMHPFWGYIIFFGIMAFVFQGIFTWAQAPMNLIGAGIAWLQHSVSTHLPPGDLRDLLADGVIAGVGTAITFLPQILLLFFFIALLEDTGYMARAAFLMDKIMSKVGLHGKSFIPLLSSFACAIPGILATRTIDDRKSRLVTILVAPLMSCSARIPVYTLMIAAFIPHRYQGLTMTAMYFLGMAAAFGMAWVFKKTLLKSAPPLFFLEMPPYHKPVWRTIVLTMFERAYLFLRRAGTVILAVSVVMWALTTYPKMSASTPPQVQMAHSYAGRAGRAIEPLIKPLGFDWRIGVSLVSSFVAREVFVSSMGTIYGVANRDSNVDKTSDLLKTQLQNDPFFSPLLAVCIMVYYVLAMQCLSTVAVVKRETNGWLWPLFMIAYMTALAWIATFLTYHIGLAFHWGLR